MTGDNKRPFQTRQLRIPTVSLASNPPNDDRLAERRREKEINTEPQTGAEFLIRFIVEGLTRDR